MAIIIEESGLKFGPFETENLFAIEKSKFYNNGKDKLRTVEFLHISDDQHTLICVEAKTTAPNINNIKSELDVKRYIHELEQKIYHSLTCIYGLCSGRHIDTFCEVPVKIISANIMQVRLIPILVITDFADEWLPQWSDKINFELSGLKRAWKIEKIVVTNENGVKKMGLVTP